MQFKILFPLRKALAVVLSLMSFGERTKAMQFKLGDINMSGDAEGIRYITNDVDLSFYPAKASSTLICFNNFELNGSQNKAYEVFDYTGQDQVMRNLGFIGEVLACERLLKNKDLAACLEYSKEAMVVNPQKEIVTPFATEVDYDKSCDNSVFARGTKIKTETIPEEVPTDGSFHRYAR